jgi:hypothetical protein
MVQLASPSVLIFHERWRPDQPPAAQYQKATSVSDEVYAPRTGESPSRDWHLMLHGSRR